MKEKFLITDDEAKQIRFCEFPGGYSPHETRGACVFDWQAAKAAVNFFPAFLMHIKGALAGQPLALEPWQKNIIGTLFGWKRKDGSRRYRTAYIEVPRKAGKSTISAGIALLLLYLDDEPGAEIYSCAAEREQAAIVFELAKQNVLRNPALEKRSTVYLRSITHSDARTGYPKGSYKVLSADAHTKHGYNPHGIIFDELHAQPNAELWEVMKTGTGARRQPLTVAITTAGYDRNSVCYQQRQVADRIRKCRDISYEGGEFLPVVYAADPDDDWTQESTWQKAQPNLGVSVPVSFYEAECKHAQELPTYENTFKRLYLNIWTEQDVRWLPMRKWRELSHDDPLAWRERMEEDLAGCECVGGLDLSTTTDITAFVSLFKRDGSFIVLPFFWIPEEGAHSREKRDRVPYLTWARQGFVKMTEGNVIDYDVVRADINELGERYNIRQIARDRWNATQITTQLQGDGFEVVDFGQGFASMSAPSKELEKLVLSGKLDHGGNPVLDWMAGNAAIESDAAGNIKPSKKKSTERIDGIVSLVMAIGLQMVLTETAKSPYSTRGIFTV